MVSKGFSETKSRTSLTLNQGLGIFQHREEGTPKAEIGQKVGLLHLRARLQYKGKVLEGNEKCYSREHRNDKEAKQPYCCAGESFSGLDRTSDQPQHSLKPEPNPEHVL